MTVAPVGLSASCRKCLPIAGSYVHRAEYGIFRSRWLIFTASEGKQHMLTVVLTRHSRESGNPEIFMTEVDSRFRGNDGSSRIQPTVRQEESLVIN